MGAVLLHISPEADGHNLYDWVACGMFFGPLAVLLR
jgi:hypothetical protein